MVTIPGICSLLIEGHFCSFSYYLKLSFPFKEKKIYAEESTGFFVLFCFVFLGVCFYSEIGSEDVRSWKPHLPILHSLLSLNESHGYKFMTQNRIFSIDINFPRAHVFFFCETMLMMKSLTAAFQFTSRLEVWG